MSQYLEYKIEELKPEINREVIEKNDNSTVKID
jgi:hypothetical protein